MLYDVITRYVEDFYRFILKVEKEHNVYLEGARRDLEVRFARDAKYLRTEEDVKEVFDAWKENILKRYPKKE